MNKIICLMSAVLLVLSCAMTPSGIIHAGDAKSQLSDVNGEISDTKGKLNEGKKKEEALGKQIREIEAKIRASQKELSGVTDAIEETMKNISQAQNDLETVKSNTAAQNENMDLRLRAMYMNGDASILEILLGSSSISDLMTNLDMVQKIYTNDAEVLRDLKKQHVRIEDQKQQLESYQAKLAAQQKDQLGKQQQLLASKEEVVALKEELSENNEALSEMLDDLKREADSLTAEIKSLQSQGTTYVGGVFAWPAPSYTKISSPYGDRIHPILGVSKFHTGVDLSAPKDSPVIAANDGIVIKAGWNNSYGNVIMIDHGGGIVTLYAHNDKLLVSVGEKVERSQRIALVGMTGDATGNHCHFEVRKDGKYVDPMQWI